MSGIYGRKKITSDETISRSSISREYFHSLFTKDSRPWFTM